MGKVFSTHKKFQVQFFYGGYIDIKIQTKEVVEKDHKREFFKIFLLY